MSSSSTTTDSDRFELICLKGSPYSERIRWALAQLQVDDYAVIKHAACSGELYLRYKVGNYNLCEPCTVPQALIYATSSKKTKPLILDNGWDIVEWANDVVKKRGSDDDTGLLIPNKEQQRTQVHDYCAMADEMQEYGRGQFLEKVKTDPTLLKTFMSQDPDAPPPPPDFMLPLVVKVMTTFMGTKYRSTLQSPHEKRKSIDANLQKLESAIRQSKPNNFFVVGNALTLADIYLAVALYNPIFEQPKDDNNNNTSSVDSNELNVKAQYPAVYQWAAAISKTFGRFEVE